MTFFYSILNDLKSLNFKICECIFPIKFVSEMCKIIPDFQSSNCFMNTLWNIRKFVGNFETLKLIKVYVLKKLSNIYLKKGIKQQKYSNSRYDLND